MTQVPSVVQPKSKPEMLIPANRVKPVDEVEVDDALDEVEETVFVVEVLVWTELTELVDVVDAVPGRH